jgi:hypothetical protein
MDTTSEVRSGTSRRGEGSYPSFALTTSEDFSRRGPPSGVHPPTACRFCSGLFIARPSAGRAGAITMTSDPNPTAALTPDKLVEG